MAPAAVPEPVMEAAPWVEPPPAPQAAAPAPINAAPPPPPMPIPGAPTNLTAAPAPAQMPALAGGGSMQSQLEAMGYEGLSFDSFGVFPIITMSNMMFTASDGRQLGQSFNCYIMKTRPKYGIKTALPDTDPRGKIVYSYDKTTDHRGRPVQESIDEWARQGINYEIKTYLEAAAVLEDGEMVLLSVPPTSIVRMTSIIGRLVGRGSNPAETLIRVGIGPQVTKAVRPFYPWAFDEAQ